MVQYNQKGGNKMARQRRLVASEVKEVAKKGGSLANTDLSGLDL